MEQGSRPVSYKQFRLPYILAFVATLSGQKFNAERSFLLFCIMDDRLPEKKVIAGMVTPLFTRLPTGYSLGCA